MYLGLYIGIVWETCNVYIIMYEFIFNSNGEHFTTERKYLKRHCNV